MKPRQKAVVLKSGETLYSVLLQPYSNFAVLEHLPEGGLRRRITESASWIFQTRRGGVIFDDDVAEYRESHLAAPAKVYESFVDCRGALMTQILMDDGTRFHLEGGDWHTFFFQLPEPYDWSRLAAVEPYDWRLQCPMISGIRHFICVMTAEIQPSEQDASSNH
ncbi:hypothetical protein HQ447_10865 [bacterium]|nr:hypothetical protein [bacterium]